MEKAIEIKRRAQRSIQSGDLDGALLEYEKLVSLPEVDPYNFVLLADLLFKRGDLQAAVERYLSATSAYETTGLFKNAIAVCKKMMRLSLSPGLVLERLAHLHGLDGLQTEASLYYQQYAEHLVRENRPADAAQAFRKAYSGAPDEVRLLERAAEMHGLAEAVESEALTLAEAAYQYRRQGLEDLAVDCAQRAEKLHPNALREYETQRLLASGHPVQAVELPAAPVDDDEENDESAHRGPPRLPAAAEPDVERFPSSSGAEVGLRFDAVETARPPAETGRGHLLSAGEIEDLLEQAQAKMRAGDTAGATLTLTEAARAYEAVGRHDNAASIFRSVGKSPGCPPGVLEEWLANCQRRGERQEAAEVLAELGDRAIAAGDNERARQCFSRALEHDSGNAHARRRIERLDQLQASQDGPPQAMPVDGPPQAMPVDVGPPQAVPVEVGPPQAMPVDVGPPQAMPVDVGPPQAIPVEAAPTPTAPALMPVEQGMPPLHAAGPAAPQPAQPAEGSSQKVELALGRSEALSFDLGSLLSEFQRGIEVQLSGDAQGHYDLAMAYREMGLLDHAVESFRMGLGHPGLGAQAAEMLGRCLLDLERFEDAITELSTALERPGLPPDSAVSLRYLVGLAHEALGNGDAAAREFERVAQAQPDFQDVARKLNDLGRTPGKA